MSVRAAFDKHAATYDESRRRLVPCFDEFYRVAAEILPFSPEDVVQVLDLGAGTGILSETIARGFPRARFTLVDVSANMLTRARQRMQPLGVAVRYRVADYGVSFGLDEPGRAGSEGEEVYDAVVSSLSIHHLDEAHKQALFRRIHGALRPGGVFVNADQVRGENAAIERRYRQAWLEQVTARGSTPAELEAAFERMREDKQSPLSVQLAYLRDAGFWNVTCWYQHYSFVVYAGEKIAHDRSGRRHAPTGTHP